MTDSIAFSWLLKSCGSQARALATPCWLLVIQQLMFIDILVAAVLSKMSLKYWLRKATCSSGVAPTLNYETDLLDSTIRRIIGLLQVGFGEAGAAIIAQNMKVCVIFCHSHGSLCERLLLSCVGDWRFHLAIFRAVVSISLVYRHIVIYNDALTWHHCVIAGVQARQAEPARSWASHEGRLRLL